MDKAIRAIFLPQGLKGNIEAKLREGRLSMPSEYIRSLIRDDQIWRRAGARPFSRRGAAAQGKE